MSFRQVVVPRPITLSGFDEPNDTLVVVGMPVVIDSVEAQLFAPARLQNIRGQFWTFPASRGAVNVQLYQPGGEIVFSFEIPVFFRERKRYQAPLAAQDRFDNELPLLARATQSFAIDPDHSLPEEARVDLVVHLIPDFYEG